MAKHSKKDIKRFWSKVDKTEECWNWNRGLTGKGYGAFSITRENSPYLAHRFSYEISGGDIDGKFLDHLCKNRKCVNPDHLEIVTLGENVRRGDLAKLNHEKVKAIRKIYSLGKATQKELGYLFEVGQDEISRIINFKRWATTN